MARATHTGICPGCRRRKLINPRGGGIRAHRGAEQCSTGDAAPVAGSVRRRSEAPPMQAPELISPVEARCREFKCRMCRADPGDRCVTIVHRRPSPDSHADRFRQAHAAGRLPLS